MPASTPDDVLVSVENVSKKFCRSLKKSLWYGVIDVAGALNPFGSQPSSNSKSKIQNPKSSSSLPPLRMDEFWAVQNVSFQLKRGECLGIIGHNGAGKSTLLKVLNGLIPPDTGGITMKGRVAALIELNAGFNPILSGRENIFNQAALLGFSKEETLSKFDAIADFADIGDFLDMPIQNYSSGMKVRLGFAVAAQMEPDILIIDEVLAVGDVGFRFKCINKIREIQQKCACIFVSHSMPQVANICSRVIHLHHGATILDTFKVEEAMTSYYSEFDASEQSESGSGAVRPVSCHLSGLLPSGEAVTIPEIIFGGGIELEVKCLFSAEVYEATIHLVIWNAEMYPVIDVQSSRPDGLLERLGIRPGDDGTTTVRCRLENIQLNSGSYSVSVILQSPDGSVVHSRLDRAATFITNSNAGSACSISSPARWEQL